MTKRKFETTEDHFLLEEQAQYYRARAGEYDQWFLRQGRYDHGEEHRRAWFAEVAEVEKALAEARPDGEILHPSTRKDSVRQGPRILELACGTGIWTQLLAPRGRVTAVDASPEVLAINRERVKGTAVRYVEADIFNWKPDHSYDFVFFGFWLSHVPTSRFDQFWSLVRDCLKPGGTAFFVDSLDSAANQKFTASDHPRPGHSGVVERKLNDGRTYHIVKVFYKQAQLRRCLAQMGWRGTIRATKRFFIYGCMQLR